MPSYTVSELNAAIGKLLERGFAPRFILNASVSRAQIKKGHLWITLTDGKATITTVVWSSRLKNLKFIPNESDGILVIGKLNFWQARANLVVEALDIRPSISTVLRQFEIVKERLILEGVIDESRRKPLPEYPRSIAILTSVPSSALADILRISKERWPLTKLFIVPIPVQGATHIARKIQLAIVNLLESETSNLLDAIVIARGGGSREDLMVFDNEELCRELSSCPIPIVTGIGHEDDWTVADLVADYRAATPTAAILSLLPSREEAILHCKQMKRRLEENISFLIRKHRQTLTERLKNFEKQNPLTVLQRQKIKLGQKSLLLKALSPDKWLLRGFALISDVFANPVLKAKDVSETDKVIIQFYDGEIIAITETINFTSKNNS